MVERTTAALREEVGCEGGGTGLKALESLEWLALLDSLSTKPSCGKSVSWFLGCPYGYPIHHPFHR
jgi:hypothetical protein